MTTCGSNELMKATVLYLRVSTEDQAIEGTSLDSQEQRCRAHATEHALSVVHTYSDIHSGSVWRERPGLTALRDAVAAGGIEVVLCYALDRLSRHQAHIAILMDEFERHGARLEMVSETFEDSAVGRFILAARAFAAEIEQEQRVERTIRGKRQRVLSGKIHRAGMELYGYRRDNTAGVRHIYEPEAAVVRLIFEWYGYERMGLRAIAIRLNQRGIPAPSVGKKRYPDGHTPGWAKSQILRMLRNPAYKGAEHVWRYEGMKWATRDESEWIAMPDHVTPAIVDPELWDRVQGELTGRAVGTGGVIVHQALMRGRISCGTCGLPMHTDSGKPNARGERYRYYRCSARYVTGRACGGRSIRIDLLDADAWEQVVDLIDDPEVLQREFDQHREGVRIDPAIERQRDALAAQLSELDRRQSRLVQDYARSEGMLFNLLKSEVAAIEDERRRIAGLLADSEHLAVAASVQRDEILNIERIAGRVRPRMGRLTFDERRALIEMLGFRGWGNGADWDVKPFRD